MSAVDQYEVVQRQGMITLGTGIFLRMEPIIDPLKTDLVNRLITTEAKDAVQDSFEKLRAIANNLMSDDQYIRKENPIKFKEYIEGLKNVLKLIYSGIPIVVPAGYDPPDHIDSLRNNFVRTLEDERRRITRNPDCRIIQVYSPISQLVRFLRNVEEHDVKPIDNLTGKRSHGNLYTLVSTFILVIYAYKETLEIWLETIKMRNR